MGKIYTLTCVAILVGVLTAGACFAAVPATMSYQGKLTNLSGQPVTDGVYNMTFTIYDGPTGGTVLWTETQSTVQVTGGLFTVMLGSAIPLLDSAFAGNSWLETAVNGTTLTPRVQIVSTGYAIHAKTADTVPDNAITSAKLADDSASLSKISGGAMTSSSGNLGIGTSTPGFPLTFSDALGDKISLFGQNPGPSYGLGVQPALLQIYTREGSEDIAFGYGSSASFTETMRIKGTGNVGIGATDPQTALDVNGIISSRSGGFQFPNGTIQTTAATAGWSLTGNAGTTPGTHFLGTADDQPLEIRVNSSRALRLERISKFTELSTNIIGGHDENSVTSGVVGATISGGGALFWGGPRPNRVTDDYGTVAGGVGNQAGDNAGQTYHNTYAAVGGGLNNIASGSGATVPGGKDNLAVGQCSLAVGQKAVANHHGTFVWNDSTTSSFSSTANNQFLVRASGGVGIGTTTPQQALSINGGMNVDHANTNNGALNPGISFGPASGEGIASRRQAGANQWGLDFYTGNTNKMSITWEGRVGIGTTAPQQALSVNGGLNIDQANANSGSLNPGISFGSLSGEGIASRRTAGENNAGLDFYTNSASRLSIANSGRVSVTGVNSWDLTNTEGDFKIGGDTYRLKFGVATGGGGAGACGIRAVGGINQLALGTGTTDTLFIQNGKVGIGGGSPGHTFYVNGSASKPGGGSWTDSSDIRLKQNIQPLTGSLDRLLDLHGVTYEWIHPEEHGNFTGAQIGMIAQDVEKVFPGWVGEDGNGYKTLTFRGFEALAVEALREQQNQIQAQQKTIDEQQKTIEELRARDAKTEARLAALEAKLTKD